MKRLFGIFLLIFFLGYAQALGSVSLIMPQRSGLNGTQITIPVKVKDFSNIISTQGTIQFDPAIVSYVSVQNFGLPGMNAASFGTTQTATGKLAFTWFDGTLLGVSLADSTTIFSITFNIIGTAGQTSALSFISVPTPIEIVDNNFAIQTAVLVDGSISVQSGTVIPDITLYADTITAATGSQVAISVRATDFLNINSCQGTIQFNPAVAAYSSISFFGLPGMNIGNFGTSQVGTGKLMFAWSDATLNGQNMADNAPLFTILFNVVGSPGSQTTLDFISTPTPLEIVDSLFNVLNVTTTAGRISIPTAVSSQRLIYYCDSVSAPTGSVVSVSVHAIDFVDIISMQGTLQFNTSIATLDTIDFFGLPGMNAASFGLSQIGSGKLMFTWNDPTLAGVTMADSAILFSMKFNLVGSPGTFTMLDFVDVPTLMETVNKDFLVVNDSLISGKLRIINNGTLDIQEPALLTYCMGSAFSTTYTATGTYIAGNMFILQISDASGSFATATNLDTVVGSTSGSFSCTLPLSLPAGNGCRIRVIATNPLMASLPSTQDISILATPGMPTIPAGVTQLCLNPANTIYTSSATNVTGAIWILYPATAGTISGAGATGTVDWNNTYLGNAYIKVMGLNGSCQGPWSDSLLVTITDYPGNASKPTGDTVLCQNPGSVPYSVVAIPNADTYAWVLNPGTAGSIIGSGTSINVVWDPAFTGIAQLTVQGFNSTCSGNVSAIRTIEVLQTPVQANVPTGNTALCMNPADENYSIAVVAGASAYSWTLYPAVAGSLTPSGNSAIVNWNDTYTGDAFIKVVGINGICQGPWSDSLMVTISAYPDAAVQPDGDTLMCQNPGTTPYTTPLITNANTYAWVLNPGTAGSIVGSGNNISVNWNPSFNGIAQLSVQGINASCNGTLSPVLSIHILTIPGQANIPSGNTTLCINPANTTYTTSPVSGATTYNWTLIPAAAGTIVPAGTSADVDWNNTYTGQAHIVVMAANGICQGLSSDTLNVNISDLPSQATQPTGAAEMCSDGPATNYTTTGALGASSYTWGLWPATAGNISGTATTATVIWNSGWSGTAYVFVMGNNSCGSGLNSDSLEVTVHPLPTAPIITTTFGTLSSSYTTGNQWYFNGALLSSETAQDYTPAVNGLYYVIYTDNNGCWSSSDTLNVNFVGMQVYNDLSEISILPNPSAGVITVTAQEIIGVDIYSATGMLVRSVESMHTASLQIDLTAIAPGLYLVKVITPASVKVMQLIIE